MQIPCYSNRRQGGVPGLHGSRHATSRGLPRSYSGNLRAGHLSCPVDGDSPGYEYYGNPVGLNVVTVSVADVRVEHEVKLDLTKWLDRSGGSPREVSDRHRIR